MTNDSPNSSSRNFSSIRIFIKNATRRMIVMIRAQNLPTTSVVPISAIIIPVYIGFCTRSYGPVLINVMIHSDHGLATPVRSQVKACPDSESQSEQGYCDTCQPDQDPRRHYPLKKKSGKNAVIRRYNDTTIMGRTGNIADCHLFLTGDRVRYATISQ